MTDQETDVTTAESSAADDTGANSAGSPTADQTDGTAGSSSADGANEPSLSDIVDRALGSEESPASGDDGEAQPKEPKSKAENEENLPDEPTEEEMKGVAPRTRRRIEDLLDQRRELREQVSGLETRAKQWDRVEEFRKANGMSAEGVANAIQIAALIENEPERAHQIVGKLYEMLSTRVGAALPEDLRDAVKRGEITRERAYELSRAKAQSQTLEERRKIDAQRQQQEQEATRLQQHTGTLAEVSTAWDKAKMASDPDWQMKRQEVAKRVEWRLKAEGMPQTPQEMQKLLEEELGQVERLIGHFRQPKPPVRPTPGGASPRGAASKAPKDHYDVVNQALGG